MSKIDIRTLNLPELTEALTSLGMQKYRAKQVYEWLWKHHATDIDEMTSLSIKQRDQLKKRFYIHPVTIAEQQKSKDGTIKYAFALHDGNIVEGVLIPTEHRYTACISSQAGCSLSCTFCATGKLKMMRNLEAAEIFDQVAIINKAAIENYGRPLTNIVYMGMGEPLLNYKNVLGSIEKITSETGLGMSPRRITVSTAGIEKAIRKLGDDQVRFNLAVSLHAADDTKRNEIMAINKSNNLESLISSLQYFYDKTNNRITYEYILFNGFNDSIHDADLLTKLTKRVPSKVNIIEYNSIDDSDFSRSNVSATEHFQKYLQNHGVLSQIRISRGSDIDAACGQLANKNDAKTK